MERNGRSAHRSRSAVWHSNHGLSRGRICSVVPIGLESLDASFEGLDAALEIGTIEVGTVTVVTTCISGPASRLGIGRGLPTPATIGAIVTVRGEQSDDYHDDHDRDEDEQHWEKEDDQELGKSSCKNLEGRYDSTTRSVKRR